VRYTKTVYGSYLKFTSLHNFNNYLQVIYTAAIYPAVIKKKETGLDLICAM